MDDFLEALAKDHLKLKMKTQKRMHRYTSWHTKIVALQSMLTVTHKSKGDSPDQTAPNEIRAQIGLLHANLKAQHKKAQREILAEEERADTHRGVALTRTNLSGTQHPHHLMSDEQKKEAVKAEKQALEAAQAVTQAGRLAWVREAFSTAGNTEGGSDIEFDNPSIGNINGGRPTQAEQSNPLAVDAENPRTIGGGENGGGENCLYERPHQ
jgi:hypothetical protein